MSEAEVVHLSPTPLVGAPKKIAEACARLGARTAAIIAADYPGPLAQIFAPGYLVWKSAPPPVRKLIEQKIAEADVLHIHNQLPPEFKPLVAGNSHGKIIYHMHSPKREGPLYVDRTGDAELRISEKVVVGSIWPRLWRDCRPLPNIVDALPSLRLIRDDEKPRVLFAPAHKRQGRWGTKVSAVQNAVLADLARRELIDLIELDGPIPPSDLLALRRSVHISIDEVVTGGFHQISCEGLCAGNAVVNGADHFSVAMLTQANRADEPPPFIQVTEHSLAEALETLVSSKPLLRDMQQRSYDYYKAWLMPERLAGFYLELYEDVLCG